MNWRKRVGVEPTDDRIACHPPVLKTGTITGPHALPLGLAMDGFARVPDRQIRIFCIPRLLRPHERRRLCGSASTGVTRASISLPKLPATSKVDASFAVDEFRLP